MSSTKYKHLLFDLDHTLWDYDRNAAEMLTELYEEYDLAEKGNFSDREFVATFFEVNEKLWHDYNLGQISKHVIRTKRFNMIFDKLHLPLQHQPQDIDARYVHGCPEKTHTMAFAFDVLDYLSSTYQMHIITNGFNDVQSTKLEKSGLAPYFDHVITSESCGAKKPAARIFEYTLEKIAADKSECIMIGDNLNTDIQGAINANIDQVYYNPTGKPHDHKVTMEINSLSDLKGLF
ncbi:MAG: YjjG family noncanonical pyrimidine nucleotidase [Bacteroidota bacterium]